MNTRKLLHGEIAEFLASVEISDHHAVSAVLDLVLALPQYREEGAALHPDVFVTTNLESMKTALVEGERTKEEDAVEFIRVAADTSDKPAALASLKRCAPLAKGEWSIYLHQSGRDHEFGVFRMRRLPVDTTPAEKLVSTSSSATGIVVVSATSSTAAEVRAPEGRGLRISFAPDSNETGTDGAALKRFVEHSTSQLYSSHAEQQVLFAQKFFNRVISDALDEGHGSLAAVLKSSRARIPNYFTRGVELVKPLDIAKRAIAYRDGPTKLTAIADLQATEAIIRGMMYCDGVTIFRPDGCIVGYNFIVRSPHAQALNYVYEGGARRHAFEQLRERVQARELASSLFRSQDGTMEVECRPDDLRSRRHRPKRKSTKPRKKA